MRARCMLVMVGGMWRVQWEARNRRGTGRNACGNIPRTPQQYRVLTNVEFAVCNRVELEPAQEPGIWPLWASAHEAA